MRGQSFGLSRFGDVLAIICVLKVLSVLAAEDTPFQQNTSSPIQHVPADNNLDGHVELSTLDLLSTSAPSHSSPTRKTFRHVIRRPIHRNSSSKINTNENFPVDQLTNSSDLVGSDKKSSIDGQALTDISKAHSVGDEQRQRDGDNGKYDVEGGILWQKGLEGTGSGKEERGSPLIEFHDNNQTQGHDQRRKVLKQIKRRLHPLKHINNLNLSSVETTTHSLEKETGRNMHRRKFLENRWHLKTKNSSMPTPLVSMSLSLEVANSSSVNNRNSKSLHEEVSTTTEKRKTEENDISMSVYPEQNDQEFSLFTQTGPEQDESLFEFIGATEQNLFDIDDDADKGNFENPPSEKIIVSLPKSFSEENTDVDENEVKKKQKEYSNPTETASMSFFNDIPKATTSSDSDVQKTTASKENGGKSIILESVLEVTHETTKTTKETNESAVTQSLSKNTLITANDEVVNSTETTRITKSDKCTSKGVEDIVETTTSIVSTETFDTPEVTGEESEKKSTPNSFATNTERIVTVDPAHWYSINTGDDVIEVQPDTEKPETTTEITVTVEQHSSAVTDNDFDTSTHSTSSTFTTEEISNTLSTEEIITVDPAHWYTLSNDDDVMEVHPDSEKSENITEVQSSTGASTSSDETPVEIQTQKNVAEVPIIGSRNGEFGNDGLKIIEGLDIKSNDRSDKALALDTNDFGVNITSTSESDERIETTSITSTTKVAGNDSLESNWDNVNENSSNGVSNKLGETTTITEKVELNITNTTENTRIITTPRSYTFENTTGVSSTSIYRTIQNQAGITALKESTTDNKDIKDFDTVTTAGSINYETSSNSMEISNTKNEVHEMQNQTIPLTFVTGDISTVSTENSTIAIGQEVKTETSPMDFLIPSLMELKPISFINISNIFAVDEIKEDDDSSEDNIVKFLFEFTTTSFKPEVLLKNNGSEDEARKNTENEFVLNQSKVMDKNASTTSNVSGQSFFGNNPVFIAKHIIGKLANVSIHIETESGFEYIPSDVYILEDLNQQLLNFTWKSSVESLNNSLALVLNRTKTSYVISRIRLNIVKEGEILDPKKDVTNASQTYQNSNSEFVIDLNGKGKITFSNLDFLKIQDVESAKTNIQKDTKPISGRHEKKIMHMEIIVGIIVIVIVILVILYIVFERLKKKKESSDKAV